MNVWQWLVVLLGLSIALAVIAGDGNVMVNLNANITVPVNPCVEVGMERDAVVAIWGHPVYVNGSWRSCYQTWEYRDVFQCGQYVREAWVTFDICPWGPYRVIGVSCTP